MKHYILLTASGIAGNVVNNNSGISDYLKSAIISTVVTALISIIGFIVTYMSMKRNFKNELSKQKSGVALDKMSTVPYETLNLYDSIMEPIKIKKQIEILQKSSTKNDLIEVKALEQKIKESENALPDKMSELLNKIYSYGSENAIRIVSQMQHENYLICEHIERSEKYRNMAFYILLATQVKYDVTGVAISPRLWYQMRLTDFDVVEKAIKEANNKLVLELNLNAKFKI